MYLTKIPHISIYKICHVIGYMMEFNRMMKSPADLAKVQNPLNFMFFILHLYLYYV